MTTPMSVPGTDRFMYLSVTVDEGNPDIMRRVESSVCSGSKALPLSLPPEGAVQSNTIRATDGRLGESGEPMGVFII